LSNVSHWSQNFHNSRLRYAVTGNIGDKFKSKPHGWPANLSVLLGWLAWNVALFRWQLVYNWHKGSFLLIWRLHDVLSKGNLFSTISYH
jgi:hypothetical protein